VTTYRYLFADLLTNSILAELPLTGVAFTQQLNQAGTFSARILLSGINAAGQNVDAATIPGRCALYVDRDGILVWGGVVWSRNYNSTSQTLTLGAREFESYFERRRITTTQAFTNTDQLAIVQTLVTAAQAVPNGDIGVIVGTETSGVLVDRVYYNYELKSVHGAIMDLSRAENGFDYRIKVQYDGAFQPEKRLLLGYPRLGTAYSTSTVNVPFFEFPAGNVVEYEYPEDGAIAANTVHALGAGSNEGKLISSASDSTLLAAGWPLLEEQANYSDVVDPALLAELAQGQVLAVSYPPTTIKMVVPAFVEPVFGTYQIGDDARVRIKDDRFPAGLDAIYRIVGISVEPGEDGPERVTLTLTTTTN
jgi:hypothetical protein